MKNLLVASLNSISSLTGHATADSTSGADFSDYYQKALLAMGVENSTAAFVKALTDPSPTTRLYAAQALGERRDTTAIGPLTAALTDESVAVRFQAARALVLLESSAGAAVLKGQLATGANPYEAVEAAGLLADLGDWSGYRRVVEALKSNDVSLQLRAVVDLIKFPRFENQPTEGGSISVVKTLSGFIDTTPSSTARVNSIYALARTHDKRAIASLTKASRSNDKTVSNAATVGLAMFETGR